MGWMPMQMGGFRPMALRWWAVSIMVWAVEMMSSKMTGVWSPYFSRSGMETVTSRSPRRTFSRMMKGALVRCATSETHWELSSSGPMRQGF